MTEVFNGLWAALATVCGVPVLKLLQLVCKTAFCFDKYWMQILKLSCSRTAKLVLTTRLQDDRDQNVKPSRMLLQQEMMRVAVWQSQPDILRRAKNQSNRCHQYTNTQFFTGWMFFWSPVSKHCGHKVEQNDNKIAHLH